MEQMRGLVKKLEFTEDIPALVRKQVGLVYRT